MKLINTFIILVLFSFICSCTAVTESTGKALDNANSVIRSGSENLWVPDSQTPEATPTPRAY